MPNLQALNPGTPSISQELGHNLGSGLSEGLANNLQRHLQTKRNKRALSGLAPSLKQSGMSDEDIDSFVNSGLDEKTGIELVKHHLKKKEEDLGKFETGLQTISAMRDIVKSGNIGRGTSITRQFGGKDARAAAEYEQLGKSLIPLVAAGVPIRNQKEFEEYKKVLTDPSSPDAAIEGALDGLERIFKGKLTAIGETKESSKTNELKEGTTFSSLPKASDHPNAILSKNGKRYVSNGKTWKEMK